MQSLYKSPAVARGSRPYYSQRQSLL